MDDISCCNQSESRKAFGFEAKIGQLLVPTSGCGRARQISSVVLDTNQNKTSRFFFLRRQFILTFLLFFRLLDNGKSLNQYLKAKAPFCVYRFRNFMAENRSAYGEFCRKLCRGEDPLLLCDSKITTTNAVHY